MMGITHKLLATGAVVCGLSLAPVAFGAGGATVTVTPKRVKEGKKVEMLVRGLKPRERVKVSEKAPFGEQHRTTYPRAGSTGALLIRIKAQTKGKHVWTFTGRRSHRTVKARYVVR